jgi:hypothetical protein
MAPLVLVVVSLALAGSPAARGKAQVSPGVYRGAVNPRGVVQSEHWLGLPVGAVEDFLDASSWATIVGAKGIVHRDEGRKRPPRYRMVYGVPIIPYAGGSVAEGAAGAYDRYLRGASTGTRVSPASTTGPLPCRSGGW